MKKSFKLQFFLCFFLVSAGNCLYGQNTQTEASKPKKDFNPSISYSLKPSKLDKDGGEIVITKEKVKNGISFFKGLRKESKQQENAQSAPIAPADEKKRTEMKAPSQPDANSATNHAATSGPAPAISTSAAFNGEWKINVAIQEKYTNSGQRQDAPASCEIGMKLKTEGQRLTGEYTWAKGGVCGIAKIEGTMTSANCFEAVISYTGGCCGGAKMKFTGTFQSADTVVGKFKPDGLPSPGCETWWATVKGERE